MRTIDYQTAIAEELEFLVDLEREQRAYKTLPRVQLLRLLKSKQATCRRACAEALGFSLMQVNRWWKTYSEEGLDALLEYRSGSSGAKPKVSAEVLDALKEEARQGRISHLKDADRFLKEKFDIRYKRLSSIWRVFKRHRIKWKTGRRRHRKADAQAQEAFKKTSG